MTNKLREKIAEKICAVINGDESSCQSTYCKNCSFRLPRVREASDQILSLLDTPAGIEYLKSQGWVKLDKERDLPPFRSNFDGSAQTIRQQDLFKAGFRRIQKECLK